MDIFLSLNRRRSIIILTSNTKIWLSEPLDGTIPRPSHGAAAPDRFAPAFHTFSGNHGIAFHSVPLSKALAIWMEPWWNPVGILQGIPERIDPSVHCHHHVFDPN